MTNHPNRVRLHRSRVRATSDGRYWVETRIYDHGTGERCWNAVARFDAKADADAEALRLNEQNQHASAMDRA